MLDSWFGAVIRFIVSAFALMFVSVITPGFAAIGFWTSLLAAIVIAFVSSTIQSVLGEDVSPYGRGGVSFLSSVGVLYLTQLIIPGVTISLVGALLAAILIGIIDMFVPTVLR